MPKLGGFFDSFSNIEQIPVEDIARWIKPAPQPMILENALANRVLYPQTIPTTPLDAKIDLAILREALRRDSAYINQIDRKIIIPESFTTRIPDITQLVWAFIDAYFLGTQKTLIPWTVLLRTDSGDEIVGSVIQPQFENKNGFVDIYLSGATTKVKYGSLVVMPCPHQSCEIGFKSKNARIFGRSEGVEEVYGGKLGLVIDGRLI